MEKIKETLNTVFRDLLAKKNAGPQDGPDDWLRKTLTKKELGHIKLQYFRKGILGLIVDSSVWLYSLGLKKESLLQQLKGYSKEIKDIRFSIGDLR